MPWISRLPPSPAATPPGGSPRGAAKPAAAAVAPVVTYIPPLVDGSCGTTPRSQRPLASLLRADAAALLRLAAPDLLLLGDLRRLRRARSLPDLRDAAARAALAASELALLLLAGPVWALCPGALFACWLAAAAALVAALGWLLGGRVPPPPRRAVGADAWTMGPEAADERWVFVGGSGESARSLAETTLPRLSRLFCRAITAVHVPTRGAPFDLLLALLLRSVPVATPSSRRLYTHLRGALLDPRIAKAVVLADGLGSVRLSRALAQLYADVPHGRLAKLEVYTFGAAAAELLAPLGEGPRREYHYQYQYAPPPPPQGPPSPPGGAPGPAPGPTPGFDARGGAPHVEHFAHEADPLARWGVLHGVRKSLEGRFCGGVFAIGDGRGAQAPRRAPSAAGMSITDYLACLFPEPGPGASAAAAAAAGVLDGRMLIDREVAEMREFAAIGLGYHATAASPGRKGAKRLSWTGLGATVDGANGVTDGVVGLEMARKGCRDCAGRTGAEVSWLARYAPAGRDAEARDGGADASPSRRR